ncbi:phosphoglycerate mutase-like protein [Trametes coccinea BRFM310]|uniref:Phosphoglycerate mutase-like protein n=1 Tax=Trametes coccinea (strain BRFM310) TaxID=1353009 RepID=A0A1Y2IX66_TRAC3|nr:phosphoglycerate mutase-like protein [Trametes coccinea BRFM310]
MSTSYKETVDPESQALLSSDNHDYAAREEPSSSGGRRTYRLRHIWLAYAAGILSAVLVELFLCSHYSIPFWPPSTSSGSAAVYADFASPDAGSTEVHNFPPASPTNAVPSLFPSDVGHAGPTPTGAEPALVATAPSYPLHTGAPHLLGPLALNRNSSSSSKSDSSFDIFKHWGNLSPWFSVERGSFGVDSGPEAPETCRVTGLHLLHRHGARYPTQWASYGGPANFSARLHNTADGWNASGQLEFMNDWTYKLGEEILTPFGRQQLYDLGVSMRMKYGFLLKNFTETNTLPVFRTESQDRMLASALNFALGFFGYPFEGQYQQSITIEDDGYNNTLAPYKTCPNARDRTKSDRAIPYVKQWADIYLKDALARLRPQMHGYELTIEDVYTLQQMCAYETVAIGYSKFCELFTEEEWKGFNYALDLYFWYDSAFGSPVARVQGIGYVQELLARLTHTAIPVHNSSTNATLDDNPVTFPLGQSLYVDATHEVVVLNVITALNLSNFAADGPLPADHIPEHRAFKSSHLAPFATNVQFQLLSCESHPDPQIRIIINDGVVPLTGIRGCPADKDGKCPVPVFVDAQREIVAKTDWNWACHGDWQVPPGPAWNTTTGDAPEPGTI